MIVGLLLAGALLAMGWVMSDPRSGARCAVVFCRTDEQWLSHITMPDPIPGLGR